MVMGPPWVPAACMTCRSVCVVKDQVAPTRCPECGSPVETYWSESDHDSAEDEDEGTEEWELRPEAEEARRFAAPHVCPDCETKRLHFESVGVWD